MAAQGAKKRFALDSNLLPRLIFARLLPPEEQNDGLILAESSLATIPVLVSSDHHLLDIPEDRLLVCFNDADLLPVRVAHPKGLLKAIR